MKIEKLFESNAKRFGTIVWNDHFFEYELALTQNPYPFGGFEHWFFVASAMDKTGNRWVVIWQPKPDADVNGDYAEQVDDWDRPFYAQMLEIAYYLDD